MKGMDTIEGHGKGGNGPWGAMPRWELAVGWT